MGMEIVTLTGYTMSQVIEKLDDALEPDAYKKVDGVPGNFTDIRPAWLWQLLNNVFGLCGIGWWYTYDTINTRSEMRPTSSGEKLYYVAEIPRVDFFYRMLVDGAERDFGPVSSPGMSDNVLKPEWAAKGAVTSALTSSASRLGWQSSVYKGHRSHTNKGAAGDAAWDSEGIEQAALSVDDVVAMSNIKNLREASTGNDGKALLAQLKLLKMALPDTPMKNISSVLGKGTDPFKAALEHVCQGSGLGEKAFTTVSAAFFDRGASTIGELLIVWDALCAIINSETLEDRVMLYKGTVSAAAD